MSFDLLGYENYFRGRRNTETPLRDRLQKIKCISFP